MKHLMTLATGIAVGAFAMYMFDPENGNRRRAQVRDKAASAGHDAERLARGAAKQVGSAAKQASGAAKQATGQESSGSQSSSGGSPLH